MLNSLLIVFLVILASSLVMAGSQLDRCNKEYAELEFSAHEVELDFFNAYGDRANKGEYNPNDVPEFQHFLKEKTALVEKGRLCRTLASEGTFSRYMNIPAYLVPT